MLSGFTSYALFSDNVESENLIVLNFNISEESETFNYNGECEEYNVPYTGYYQVEAWGAESGYSLCTGTKCSSESGKGGYTSGIIKLIKGETLYFCVGEKGSDGALGVNSSGGYNGGGLGTWDTTDDETSGGGGGATDIRLVDGTWDDEEGLNSRIMVAAGGGGASWTYDGGSGGGLVGKTTFSTNSVGTQISGYAFGKGEDATGVSDSDGVGGGGSGYYGGYAPDVSGKSSGTGGSSFISGYAGVNAITSNTDRTHTNNTLHYSNKYFIKGVMKSGENSGNGKAKISLLGTEYPRTNKTLNNVRYVKDCMNGNTNNTPNHWVELQAIYNGVNIALNTTITSTISADTNYGTGVISSIVDGDITSYNYVNFSSGNQCVTVDLGDTYDLDEVAVWHYWSDGRTYYDNYTYVSSDNTNWTLAIDRQVPETSEGKRVNAYESSIITIKQTTGGTLTCTNNTTGISSTTSLSVTKGDSITCTGVPISGYKVSTLKLGSDSYTSGTSFIYDYDTSRTAVVTYQDITPPSTPVLTNSSSGNWTNENVILTATSTDNESGVSYIQYSYDNSSWTTWTEKIETVTNGKKVTETWSDERNKTVYVRAIDNAGNVSDVSTTTVKIDKTAASTPTLTNSSGGNWTNSNVTLTATSTDTGSGINYIQYSYDNSSWTTWTEKIETVTNGKKVTGTWSDERNKTVYVRAVDNAGNISTVSTTAVKIDKKVPSTPTLTNSSSGNWTNSNVTITASSTDTSSGINYFQYSYDNSSWTTWTGGTLSTITNGKKRSDVWSDQRNNTVYIRAVDNAGNVSGVSTTTVKIDKTAPSTPTLTNSSSGSWTNSNVTLTATSTDTSSGINYIQYSYDNSSWTTWTEKIETVTNGKKVTGTWSVARNSTVYVRAVDNAGNISSVSTTTVKIDKTGPTVSTFTISSNTSSYNSKSTTIKVTGSDSSSGLGTVCISTSNSYSNCSWQSISSGSYTNSSYNVPSSNGSGNTDTLYAFIKDKAGNISSVKTASYKLYKYCSSTTASYGSWGSCSATCGGGTQYRTITYKDKYYTSYSCGTDTDSQSCNTQSCLPSSVTLYNSAKENNIVYNSEVGQNIVVYLNGISNISSLSITRTFNGSTTTISLSSFSYDSSNNRWYYTDKVSGAAVRDAYATYKACSGSSCKEASTLISLRGCLYINDYSTYYRTCYKEATLSTYYTDWLYSYDRYIVGQFSVANGVVYNRTTGFMCYMSKTNVEQVADSECDLSATGTGQSSYTTGDY